MPANYGSSRGSSSKSGTVMSRAVQRAAEKSGGTYSVGGKTYYSGGQYHEGGIQTGAETTKAPEVKPSTYAPSGFASKAQLIKGGVLKSPQQLISYGKERATQKTYDVRSERIVQPTTGDLYFQKPALIGYRGEVLQQGGTPKLILEGYTKPTQKTQWYSPVTQRAYYDYKKNKEDYQIPYSIDLSLQEKYNPEKQVVENKQPGPVQFPLVTSQQVQQPSKTLAEQLEIYDVSAEPTKVSDIGMGGVTGKKAIGSYLPGKGLWTGEKYLPWSQRNTQEYKDYLSIESGGTGKMLDGGTSGIQAFTQPSFKDYLVGEVSVKSAKKPTEKLKDIYLKGLAFDYSQLGAKFEVYKENQRGEQEILGTYKSKEEFNKAMFPIYFQSVEEEMRYSEQQAKAAEGWNLEAGHRYAAQTGGYFSLASIPIAFALAPYTFVSPVVGPALAFGGGYISGWAGYTEQKIIEPMIPDVSPLTKNRFFNFVFREEGPTSKLLKGMTQKKTSFGNVPSVIPLIGGTEITASGLRSFGTEMITYGGISYGAKEILPKYLAFRSEKIEVPYGEGSKATLRVYSIERGIKSNIVGAIATTPEEMSAGFRLGSKVLRFSNKGVNLVSQSEAMTTAIVSKKPLRISIGIGNVPAGIPLLTASGFPERGIQFTTPTHKKVLYSLAKESGTAPEQLRKIDLLTTVEDFVYGTKTKHKAPDLLKETENINPEEMKIYRDVLKKYESKIVLIGGSLSTEAQMPKGIAPITRVSPRLQAKTLAEKGEINFYENKPLSEEGVAGIFVRPPNYPLESVSIDIKRHGLIGGLKSNIGSFITKKNRIFIDNKEIEEMNKGLMKRMKNQGVNLKDVIPITPEEVIWHELRHHQGISSEEYLASVQTKATEKGFSAKDFLGLKSEQLKYGTKEVSVGDIDPIFKVSKEEVAKIGEETFNRLIKETKQKKTKLAASSDRMLRLVRGEKGELTGGIQVYLPEKKAWVSQFDPHSIYDTESEQVTTGEYLFGFRNKFKNVKIGEFPNVMSLAQQALNKVASVASLQAGKKKGEPLTIGGFEPREYKDIHKGAGAINVNYYLAQIRSRKWFETPTSYKKKQVAAMLDLKKYAGTVGYEWPTQEKVYVDITESILGKGTKPIGGYDITQDVKKGVAYRIPSFKTSNIIGKIPSIGVSSKKAYSTPSSKYVSNVVSGYQSSYGSGGGSTSGGSSSQAGYDSSISSISSYGNKPTSGGSSSSKYISSAYSSYNSSGYGSSGYVYNGGGYGGGGRPFGFPSEGGGSGMRRRPPSYGYRSITHPFITFSLVDFVTGKKKKHKRKHKK